MSNNKKFEQGLEKVKSAEKSLKTSLLKWRPDYEVAASEYQEAANCFKNSKDFEQSKECLMKAAECHKQSRSFFHAAKCIDQAILLAKDLNDYREVMQLAERACNLYQQHGSPESGAAALDRAAKILEQHEPELALRLYQRAADVVMIEDSSRQAAEFISKVARILVRLKMYDQAADAIRREIGLHQQTDHLPAIGRLAVALVLVQLAREDNVAAEKAFKEWGNCCDAQEVQNLELLLQGFDDEDPEAVRQALNHPFIKHMDVEYAKLARDLPLPQGIAVPNMTGVRENAAPSYISPNAAAVTTAHIESCSQASDAGAAGTAAARGSDDEDGLC